MRTKTATASSEVVQEDFAELIQVEQSKENWKPVREDFNLCRLPYFIASNKKSDRFRTFTLLACLGRLRYH